MGLGFVAASAILPSAYVVASSAFLVALFVWSQRLKRVGALSRLASWSVHGLVVVAWLVALLGAIGAVRATMAAGEGGEAVDKARALAEGISESMNSGALAFGLGLVGGSILILSAWRNRRASK